MTYRACDLPQWEMSLIPLIVVTTVLEVLFFSIRVWSMWKRQHKRGADDIMITVAFVSTVPKQFNLRRSPKENLQDGGPASNLNRGRLSSCAGYPYWL